MNQKLTRVAVIAAIALLFTGKASAADAISADALAQVQSISAVKAAFTPTQKKLATGLAFGIMAASNDARVAPFRNAITPMTTSDVAPAAAAAGGATTSSQILVDIEGTASDDLANAIVAAQGVVKYRSARWGVINASLPVSAVLSIAARSDVRRIKGPSVARSNVGSVTSQGYVSHEANKAVAVGYNGSGVTVGVLSDSASAARIAALQATGDLPANTQVLPGQNGPSDGSDEGTAMMEIVYDLAPGASLKFATAFTSEASFADNIIALAAAGCKVIVDDVSYSGEGAFQDGIIARAVNQVTASGSTYFSSAGNSGSLTKGTSSTYEADFVDGGPVSGVVGTTEGGVGRVHNFGSSTSVVTYNTLATAGLYVELAWADPLGASDNDYDLFVLNPAGTAVLGFGGDVQDGTGDPYEIAFRSNGTNFPVGSRVVIVRYAGAARAMHLDTFNTANLSIATSGATVGHNAAAQTMSMAATYWNSAKTGARPFTGFPNTNETFSSDGPRKIFYRPDGTPITPGNFLFATSGGTTLIKPDLSAADGVTTKTPGFQPFFGTSAAAPHAAGIAALVLSARPGYTPDQVKTAMRATALDSMSAGVDRDSGYGVAAGYAAVQYAIAHP